MCVLSDSVVVVGCLGFGYAYKKVLSDQGVCLE